MNGFKSALGPLVQELSLVEKHKNELYGKLPQDRFSSVMETLAEKSFSLVLLCAEESDSDYSLFYVFEKRGHQGFLILETRTNGRAPSIAALFPSACWYEREIQDGFGIRFEELYDARRLFLHETYPPEFHPLKRSFKNDAKSALKLRKTIRPDEEYIFKPVHGEGVYHIPVGPVHAGIIEPGHFRFSVIGETIFNLEVRLFWKHRGIEKLAEMKTAQEAILLAEAISGDETIANAWGFCLAVEKISAIQVPKRAEYLRILCAEMERIFALLGDLAGMVVDVAYPAGASSFFILREEILRWNEKISSSRFLKNSLCIGGVAINPTDEVLSGLETHLHHVSSRLSEAVDHVLSFPPVLDRFESTGVVRKELVHHLHLSGPLARASGIESDVRRDHPYGLYSTLVPRQHMEEQGDVLARFRVKAATIQDSISLIRRAIQEMPGGEVRAKYVVKNGRAFAATESARGQNIHVVHIHDGKIVRYKARTASFCNWQAIEHAVLGNIVPDFPLINKSMNLSYAGTDL